MKKNRCAMQGLLTPCNRFAAPCKNFSAPCQTVCCRVNKPLRHVIKSLRHVNELLRPALKFPAFPAKIPQRRTMPAATALFRQPSSDNKTGRANNVTI